MNIQQLAEEMGVQECALQSFVNCLRVWTDKGHTLEEAITKHKHVIDCLKANPEKAVEWVKPAVIDHFYQK